ncbi:MAG TPA: hypothetical protein VLH79_11940 [Chthonomonadales bacterium]|nr:hypothetical protein [Chthonomonadales bacterium]
MGAARRQVPAAHALALRIVPLPVDANVERLSADACLWEAMGALAVSGNR